MNNSTKSSGAKIEHALLDVRKAYRLLHDYQRMVLDAVNYIGKQFGASYGGGYAKYSAVTPRDGKGHLDCCAWDWLNMVLYEFFFTQKLEGDNLLRFSILIISDTGYFCAEDKALEKTNVAGYIAPDRSLTKVGFIISGKEWPDLSFMEDKATMKMFIENDGEIPVELAASGILGKCVDLARLASEEETNVLLDELVVLAQANGIPLKRIAPKAWIF